jgi:hypothetical protein
MSLYDQINAMLARSLQTVDSLIHQHIEMRKDGTKALPVTWGDDTAMTATIVHIKNICKVAANSVLKFVLVLRAKPSDSAVKSILDELTTQVDMLVAHYM